VRPVLFADFGNGLAFEVEALRRLFHHFHVTQRADMHAQGRAQGLAVEVGLRRQHLLVDADGQRLAIAEDGKTFLQLLEDGTRGGGLGRCCGIFGKRGIH